MPTMLDRLQPQIHRLGAYLYTDVTTAGLRIDAAVRTPADRWIAVELREWNCPLTAAQLEKGTRLSQLLREVAGFDQAYVLVPSLREPFPAKNIVNEACLLTALSETISQESLGALFTLRRPDQTVSALGSRPIVFAATPFASRFDDTYFLGIAYATNLVGAVAIRQDEDIITGSIIKKIHTNIERARVMVADLTDFNPNVMYELGYAHALRKPTIHILAADPSSLPFDVRDWATIRYDFGQIHVLREKLATALKATLCTSSDDNRCAQ